MKMIEAEAAYPH